MEGYIQVVTAIAKRENAEKIANALVEKRLAACVQILGPIVSTYWWKDNIETAEEWLCVIKSKKDVYEELEKSIKEIHPYETPEIFALPVVAGSKDYLKWLSNEVKKK
uniref:Divalent-cation tolerance protein CutA n=1 Tax=Candidatus Methanophagaceae archaeon ANME-1 ERB6 TaxID=2759912 RepID=A0A7G9Z0P7_9EURY|nr:divalent-cation tolerance protein CutA [Methanosarcinales archaeon ANME-1 ERB6]